MEDYPAAERCPHASRRQRHAGLAGLLDHPQTISGTITVIVGLQGMPGSTCARTCGRQRSRSAVALPQCGFVGRRQPPSMLAACSATWEMILVWGAPTSCIRYLCWSGRCPGHLRWLLAALGRPRLRPACMAQGSHQLARWHVHQLGAALPVPSGCSWALHSRAHSNAEPTTSVFQGACRPIALVSLT